MTFLLSLLCLLLVAPLALAADGDVISKSGEVRTTPMSIQFLLCDTKTANGTCADLRIGPKIPVAYQFTIDEDDNCTAYTVTIQTRARANGDIHDLAALGFGLVTSHIHVGPLHERILATITGEADCTNLDVVVEVFYDRAVR